MSAIVKAKHAKSKPISTTALWLVLGLAVTFFLVRYGQELLLEHSLKDQAGLQRRENSALADDNNRLNALLQYYQSDRYIEHRAREDLNLRLKDETVLIPLVTAES